MVDGMTTTAVRRVLLPLVVAFLLLALFAAPQRSSAPSSPRAAVSSSAVSPADSPESSEPGLEAEFEQAPVDRATVLSTQFTAGVRGSRAPPAASA